MPISDPVILLRLALRPACHVGNLTNPQSRNPAQTETKS
jgi:hypothetical protein